MEQWFYTITLGVSIAGLMIFDWRHKFALFRETRRSLLTIGAAMIAFIVWDALGIFFGIFYSGGSPFALSYMLAPEFPSEEILFLFLLCYVTLLIYRGVQDGYCHIPRT